MEEQLKEKLLVEVEKLNKIGQDVSSYYAQDNSDFAGELLRRQDALIDTINSIAEVLNMGLCYLGTKWELIEYDSLEVVEE